MGILGRLFGSEIPEVRSFRVDRGEQSVSCLAFDPDGLLALSGGLDGSVRLWDIESGK
ncbi:MAG: hypothetical protein M3283_13225 [Actinomycetota bacterium]|nr:hypothetical protein [Actinomycetota bacterium]